MVGLIPGGQRVSRPTSTRTPRPWATEVSRRIAEPGEPSDYDTYEWHCYHTYMPKLTLSVDEKVVRRAALSWLTQE